MSVAGPRFDLDRFGAALPRFTPRQADLLMVVGTITHRQAPILRRVWEQMAEPKWVMSFGACTVLRRPVQQLRRRAGHRHDHPGRHLRPGLPAAPGGGARRPAEAAGARAAPSRRRNTPLPRASHGSGRAVHPETDDAACRPITIDGPTIEAPDGAMLLPVALDNGIQIPHYCYHPKLSIDGSCRMCQVKVEGSPKLVDRLQHAGPRRHGRRTQTPEVANARQGVMELLLVNHPLDCPICDQAGECYLQDYSFDYGSREARTQRAAPQAAEAQGRSAPRVVLDQERCILCRRCVRFCREITETDELGVFDIGDHSRSTSSDDDRSPTTTRSTPPTSARSARCASKDFHHKLRVWFLKKTESVCPSCSNGCNVTVASLPRRIWRLLPRRNDAVNDTWMCDHGRLNYQLRQQHRAAAPAAACAATASWKPCEWDEALAAAARAPARTPPRTAARGIGAVASPHLTNEEHFRFAQLLRALGVANVDVAVVDRAERRLPDQGGEGGQRARRARPRPAPARAASDCRRSSTPPRAATIRVLYVCGAGSVGDSPTGSCSSRRWPARRVPDRPGHRPLAAGRARARRPAVADVRREERHLHQLTPVACSASTGRHPARGAAERRRDLHAACSTQLERRRAATLRPGGGAARDRRRRCRRTPGSPSHASGRWAGSCRRPAAAHRSRAPDGDARRHRRASAATPRVRTWALGRSARARCSTACGVTSRHFFRNLWGFIRGKPTVFTVQFPEQRLTQPRRLPRHAGARADGQRQGALRRLRPVRVGLPDRLHHHLSRPRPRTRSSAIPTSSTSTCRAACSAACARRPAPRRRSS